MSTLLPFLLSGVSSLFLKNLLAFFIFLSLALFFYVQREKDGYAEFGEELQYTDILLFSEEEEKESTLTDRVNIYAVAAYILTTLILAYAFSEYLFLFFLVFTVFFFIRVEKLFKMK